MAPAAQRAALLGLLLGAAAGGSEGLLLHRRQRPKRPSGPHSPGKEDFVRHPSHANDDALMRRYGYEASDLEEGVVIAPAEKKNDVCVLSVPGLGRYCSQFEVGEKFGEIGIDFCGLDYRRYGRHYMRSGRDDGGKANAFNFITDIRDYWSDIDDAICHLHEDRGYKDIILMGDSTGGLSVTSYLLFCSAMRGHRRVKMCVLNSPLLKFNAVRMNWFLRFLSRFLGVLQPYRVVSKDQTKPRRTKVRWRGFRREVRFENKAYWFDRVCQLHGHKYDPRIAPADGGKPVYLGYVRACVVMMARVMRAVKGRGEQLQVPALLFSPGTDLHREMRAKQQLAKERADDDAAAAAGREEPHLPAPERPAPQDDRSLHIDPHIDVRGVATLFDRLFPNGRRMLFPRANHEVMLSEWDVVEQAMRMIKETAVGAGILKADAGASDVAAA